MLLKLARGVEKKNKQTSQFIVQSNANRVRMNSAARKVWNKPHAKNIKTIFFQDQNGKLHRFDRPEGGQ